MSKTYILIPDQHAHPDHHNDRADWLSQLIIDVKPDTVVNMGDTADVSSLSDYDRGKRSFVKQNYRKDINSHLEFQDRLWGPVRATKKKMPYRVVLEGNHEHRIEKALDANPQLVDTIGFEDFEFEENYHEVVRYDGGTPGIIELDGILFAHYFITGVAGRPLGGERPGHFLLAKHGTSCIAAHSHTFDHAVRRTVQGRVLNGLVVGCYQDYIPEWAGNIGRLWRSGVAILRGVDNGDFDLEWVSINRMKEIYGT